MAVNTDEERSPPKTIKTSCGQLMSRINRKQSPQMDVMKTNLHRCLTTLDMTALSIGYIVSSGIYVVTSNAAKQLAGPSIILSFLISGFAATLSAFCYAELGAKFPRAGSTYTYTYLTMGEIWAFLIAWNLILADVIAAASVARSFSAYIDSLTGGVIRNATLDFIGTVHVPYIAEYFDFLAVCVLILVVLFLSFGVRLTSKLTLALSATNITALLIVIGVGAYFSDTANWTNHETGGFMPFGWSGVLSASAACFYTYAGFECVCSLGEEAKDPLKSIPRSITITMATVTSVYIGVATVLTLMINYQDLIDDSGLPEALASHGAYWAKYAVVVGALCGMSTSLMMCISVVGRLVYTMAEDGLLFNFCTTINRRTQIPLRATYVASALAVLLTLIMDIDALVELYVIGVVSGYIIVSASVIILRYKPTKNAMNCTDSHNANHNEIVSNKMIGEIGQLKKRFQSVRKYIDWYPCDLVTKCVILFTIFVLITCGFVNQCYSDISSGTVWAVAILVVLLVFILSCFTAILIHQETTSPQIYKIPLSPYTPSLSILINSILIVNVTGVTWLRLLIWLVIGLLVYFTYSIRNSKLSQTKTLKLPSSMTSVT